MIKIFVFPTHCSDKVTVGVDYVRMIMPMKELQKDPRFKVTIFDAALNSQKLNWDEIAQEYDILYLNYLTLPFDFALFGMLFRKYGKKIVLDIDDLIWEIQTDNSSYETYKPGSEGRAVITDICREVDYVTCTNTYLKNGIAHYTQKKSDKIRVFPNRINLEDYTWRTKPVKKHNIRIGYFGSSSHFQDLASTKFVKAMERLMSDYPNIELVTIGAMVQHFKKKFGMRYVTDYGDQDIYKWIAMFPEKLGDVDIFAVPLIETTYNKAKSSIKFLEMSSTGKPGCWENIRQYSELVQHGKNGYLCTTEDEWYANLKKLIDSAELREKMGRDALRTVEQKWTIQDHVKDYAAFFLEVMK